VRSRRLWLLLYLAVWSTIAARLSFEFVYIIIPKRSDFGAAVQIVPFVAFPISFGIAFKLLRRSWDKVSSALGRYLWLTPVLLFFALLFAVALMAASVAPVAFFFVLILGFIFGLPALLIGIPIHAIGLIPLIYFDDRLFGPKPTQAAGRSP
jgi:hypothetical protein